jgi:hypothetical protein
MSDLFWWAIGGFGLGIPLLLVGAILFFGWPVVAAILIRYWKILLPVGLAILAALGLYAKGRAEGRAAERAKLKKLTEKEVANAAKERKRIDGLTDAQVDRELAKWDRK